MNVKFVFKSYGVDLGPTADVVATLHCRSVTPPPQRAGSVSILINAMLDLELCVT